MKNLLKFLFGALLALVLWMTTPAWAVNKEPIQQAIAAFIETQSKSLPGPVTFTIGAINADGLSSACRRMDAKMNAGAPPWGRTHINVHCVEGATWSLFVPITIHVEVEYLVSARPLRAGQLLVEADIARRNGDLAELPSGILTDSAQALGHSSRVSIPADRTLRADMLSVPSVVKQGQSVKVLSGGAGFHVASEGRALNSATPGQVVQVRVSSGQIISGIARSDGVVEIAH